MARDGMIEKYVDIDGKRVGIRMPGHLKGDEAAAFAEKEYDAGRFRDLNTDKRALGAAQTLRSWYDAGAQAVTAGVGEVIGNMLMGAQDLGSTLTGGAIPRPADMRFREGPVLGGQPGTIQGGAKDIGMATAKMVVPQSPVEAAVMATTMGMGGLAANAGWKAAATRVLTSTATGMGAGVATGSDPMDAAIAAGIISVGGEGAATGLNAAANRVYMMGSGRAKRFVSRVDAEHVGAALREIPELRRLDGRPLFNVRTPDDIRILTKEGVTHPQSGYRLLGEEQDKMLGEIVKQVGGDAPKFISPKKPTKDVPVDFSNPRNRLYADLVADAKDVPNYVPARQVKDELHEMWYDASRMADPKAKREAMETYGKAKDRFGEELLREDQTGVAEGLFRAMQMQYRVAKNTLDMLLEGVQPALGRENTQVMFDMSKVQRFLNRDDTQREWQSKVIPEIWDKIKDTVWRGAHPGRMDMTPRLFAPPMADAAAVATGGGLGPAAAYHGVRAVLQGPKFVGDIPNPVNFAPSLNLTLQRGGQTGGRIIDQSRPTNRR